jgi:hypothetical protein
MELLNRYLQAVRFFLPRAQQDDIVRELSENLHSAIEDREGDLGRPLTEDELAALLRAHGHPMMVAGRYRSNQQLIGPTFFPIYVFALKAGLGIALLVTVVLLTIGTVMQGDAGRHLLEAFLAYPGRALMVFAWTTLGFAALDWARTRVKLTHSWDPRTLPALVAPGDAISRTRSICEFLLVSAATIWLAMLPWAPVMIFGPAAAFIAPGPVWSTVYPAILLMSFATLALHATNVARPFWTPTRGYLRAALHAGGVVVTLVLLRATELVVAVPGATLPDGRPVAPLVEMLNQVGQLGMAAATVVGIIETIRALHGVRSRRARQASAANRKQASHFNGA